MARMRCQCICEWNLESLAACPDNGGRHQGRRLDCPCEIARRRPPVDGLVIGGVREVEFDRPSMSDRDISLGVQQNLKQALPAHVESRSIIQRLRKACIAFVRCRSDRRPRNQFATDDQERKR